MLSKYAFAFVGARLYNPKAVEDSGQATDPASGMSVRKVTAWDPVRSMRINRLDSNGGFGNLYQGNGSGLHSRRGSPKPDTQGEIKKMTNFNKKSGCWQG